MPHPLAVHLSTMTHKRRKHTKDFALTAAAKHSMECLCNNCMIYRAVIGTLEEHGPFEVADLNDVRSALGYPQGLMSEDDLYGKTFPTVGSEKESNG